MKRRAHLYVYTFLLMFAIGLALPISPLLALRLGANWIEIGIMGSAWGIVFTLSAFMTGRLSDVIGRKPVLAFSSVLSALAALMFLRASTITELIVTRALEGLAWACFWPPMEALATETADAQEVGKGIGRVTSIYALGFAAGSSVAGSITSFFGLHLAFAVYFVVASIALTVLWYVKAPRHVRRVETSARTGVSSLLTSHVVVAGNILGASYTFGLATVMALLSAYATGLGISLFWIGIVFSVFWTGRILGAALAGGASDRFGRKQVASLALVIGAGGFIIIALVSDLPYLATGVFLAGLSVGATFPVNVAIIADGVELKSRGTAMGLYEMVCALAFMVSSALGGVSAEALSPRSPYAMSAAVFVSCAVALSIFLPPRHLKSREVFA